MPLQTNRRQGIRHPPDKSPSEPMADDDAHYIALLRRPSRLWTRADVLALECCRTLNRACDTESKSQEQHRPVPGRQPRIIEARRIWRARGGFPRVPSCCHTRLQSQMTPPAVTRAVRQPRSLSVETSPFDRQSSRIARQSKWLGRLMAT
jgi:hypothetical protein